MKQILILPADQVFSSLEGILSVQFKLGQNYNIFNA